MVYVPCIHFWAKVMLNELLNGVRSEIGGSREGGDERVASRLVETEKAEVMKGKGLSCGRLARRCIRARRIRQRAAAEGHGEAGEVMGEWEGIDFSCRKTILAVRVRRRASGSSTSRFLLSRGPSPDYFQGRTARRSATVWALGSGGRLAVSRLTVPPRSFTHK